jgi:hypothetical protein
MPATTLHAKELKNIRQRIDRFFKLDPKQPIRVVVPDNLSKENVLALIPTSTADKELWVDSLYYLMHLIITRSQRKKFKNNRRVAGYVALKFDYLEDFIGPEASQIIKWAIASKFIECDQKMIIDVESYGYRLSANYRKTRLRHVTLTHSKLVKHHRKVDKKLFTEQRDKLREHAYLLKWLMDSKLELNLPDAIEYTRLFKYIIGRSVAGLNLSKKEKEEIQLHVSNTVANSIFIINSWKKKPGIKIDSKGGRLYSPLTNMMSKLRFFLTYDSEELVYFDIKNSQPYHLILLLNPAFWQRTGKSESLTLESLNKELADHLATINNKELASTIMTLESAFKSGLTQAKKGLQRKGNMSPRFAKLVVDGKLYKFISDEFKGKFLDNKGFDPFLTDKSAKGQLISMLYSNPRASANSANNKHFKHFKTLFPVEAKVIELLKSRKYNDFSILLQKVESTILLKEVCYKIFEHNTSIPLFTIHDGIMTTAKYADVVEKFILDTYKSIVGVEPTLSKEVMNNRNAGANFKKYVQKKLDEILVELKRTDQIKPLNLNWEDFEYVANLNLFKTKSIGPFDYSGLLINLK